MFCVKWEKLGTIFICGFIYRKNLWKYIYKSNNSLYLWEMHGNLKEGNRNETYLFNKLVSFLIMLVYYIYKEIKLKENIIK